MSVLSKTDPPTVVEHDGMTSDLTTIPNVGPAVARKLQRLGFHSVTDLRGQDGRELFERFCVLEGAEQDPCLLDTFMAVADFADGGPARPWWEYSRERKAQAHA
jgi:Pathogenicity locus